MLLLAHGATLDLVAVLGVLPQECSLSKMEPVIEPMLGHSASRRRDAQMLRALH